MEIKLLRHGDQGILTRVLADVFDNPIDKRLTEEFLSDPRHHLAVAIDDAHVVGFASAVHYVHPDKQPELWINEVSVAPSYRARGIGKALLSELLDAGRKLGCVEAWVLTDRSNVPAMRLYSSLTSWPPSDHTMFSFPLDAAS